MALSPKEREKIIEEETLRYETRRNLHHQHCASKRPIWPWILGGAAAAWLLYCWIFCGSLSCAHGMHGKAGCSHHQKWELPSEKDSKK